MSVRIHYFKTWPEAFEPAAICAKLHEIRKDDRDLRPATGDVVILREWRQQAGTQEGDYTGRQLRRVVTHVSAPGTWGLPTDVYVMTLLPEEAPR